jgi:hypothetical protein
MSRKEVAAKFLRDNPILDRHIEVGTKALRRELMSGETLRAPRQQLRRLRASVFDLLSKFNENARLPGAHLLFVNPPISLGRPEPFVPIPFIRKTVGPIRKNKKGEGRHRIATLRRCREQQIA